MNNTKSLKLGAAFAAALALAGCDKPLPSEAVQARMDQIFTEIDKLPLATTTHSLQIWSDLADENSACAVVFHRTGGVEYDTESLDSLGDTMQEAVIVSCEDLEKAKTAATRDLSLKYVHTREPFIHDGQRGQAAIMEQLRNERESFKNGIANKLRDSIRSGITDIRFVPPPAPFKP